MFRTSTLIPALSVCSTLMIAIAMPHKASAKDAVLPKPVASIEAAFSVRQSKQSSYAGVAYGAVSDDLPAALFATEPRLNKLLRLDAGTGRVMSEAGGEGSAIGKLSNPGALDIVGDRVYVLDRGNRRIQIFNGARLNAEPFAFGDKELKNPLALLVDDPTDATKTVDVVDLDAGKLFLQRFVLNQEVEAKDGQRNILLSVASQQRKELGAGSSDPVSMVRDAGNNRYLIGQAGQFWEVDESGQAKAFALPNLPTFKNSTSVGLYACRKADRGYWVIADSSSKIERLLFLDRTSFAPVATVQLKGVQRLTDVTITRDPIAYMPFGAIYGVANGQSVVAINWDGLSISAGLMRLCMSG